MDNDNLYLKIKNCLQLKGSALRELGEYIIEDIYKKEVSTAYLDQVCFQNVRFIFVFFLLIL